MAVQSVADIDGAALKKVFSKLVEGLKAVDVIDQLYENDLLSREEYEGIFDACLQASSKEDSRNVNRRVLIAIRRRPPGFVAKLVEILRKKDTSLADALEKALTEVSSQHRTDPAPSQQFTQDVHPSSSGVITGPMSEWNVNALEALRGKLKLNVKMTKLVDLLPTAAGGFMDRTEAQRVRDRAGDAQQMDQIIDILLGKGDSEFALFSQMLWQSNYQVWAHQLELEAKKFKTSAALPGTDPAPLRGNHQAVVSMSAHTPDSSREVGVPTQRSDDSTTHPLSPKLKNVCWPEFDTLQDEFSTLVSKLPQALHALNQTQFDSLLVYLRERLRPMVNGCFPTEGPPNLPNGPTPSELLQHLQNCHYWNYLNTNLLEDIIRHVTKVDSPLRSLMDEYKKNVCSKVTATLEECKRKNVKPEPPPGYTTMAVEIDTGGNPLSVHLYWVLQFKDVLVKRFGVSDALFAGFTEGSIVLYFYIPEEAMYSLCPKLEANCTVLEEQHVTTLVMFDHFSVDVGYQQMSILNKEEVARLKQELKKSEVNREKLSAELRECRKTKVESRVSLMKPLSLMRQSVKEEGGGEEPECKRVKTEVAGTVVVKLEGHTQEEKEEEGEWYDLPIPSIISERGPQTPSVFPPPSPYSSELSHEVAVPTSLPPPSIELGPPRAEQTWDPPQGDAFPVFRGASQPVLQPSSLLQPVQMGPPGSQQTQVPPQGGVFPPHVFSGTSQPVRQPSSLPQPVLGSQQTQGGVILPHVFSGASQPVFQPSSLLQPVQMGPPGSQQAQVLPQGGVFPSHMIRGASQPVHQPSSLAQPVRMTSLGSQQSQIFQTGPLLHGRCNMQSVKLPDLPIPTCDASAVMVNEHIYVCGGFCGGVNLARQVQVYDISRMVWRTLPHSPQYNSEGVAINNKLVLIGGCEAASYEVTNLVSTWTGQGWQQDLPPMPTKRLGHGVTTYRTFVVVTGGRAEDKQTLLSSIDILNITTRQWWTPANLQLPQPMCGMKITTSSAHLCVASADIRYNATTDTTTPSKDVWQLPVTALENIHTNGDSSTPHQWTKVAPTSYYDSATLQDTAHIVTVGGDDDSDQPTSDVFIYNPDSDKWSKVGQLGVPRTRCAVVSLSRTSFIVCGGCTDTRDAYSTLLSSVEVVHV